MSIESSNKNLGNYSRILQKSKKDIILRNSSLSIDFSLAFVFSLDKCITKKHTVVKKIIFFQL